MSIKVIELQHIYSQNTPFEFRALENINFTIEKGEFIGLIGNTGSGKSTLIQHLNSLLKPTSGTIIIDNINLAEKEKITQKVRHKVGLVFQYPENQLFEETVEKDVAFGPKNLGLNNEEIKDRVYEAICQVGLDYDSIKDKSPFELSGGQMRRVAIAGVLAMKPDILILDEPTAGLDPKGRDEILCQIKNYHKNFGITVLLVSHSMEEVAQYVQKIIVMHKGEIKLYDTPKNIFSEIEMLEEIGLGVPQVTYLMKKLKEFDSSINDNVYTVEEAKVEIIKMLRRV